MAHEHLDRLNRDRLALADRLVKAWREINPDITEDEIVLKLQAEFRPKLADTLAGAIQKSMLGAKRPNVFEQSVAKDATGAKKGLLSKGRGTWTPSVSVDDLRKDRERAADLKKQIANDRKGVR